MVAILSRPIPKVKTKAVQTLKFANGYGISSHALFWM